MRPCATVTGCCHLFRTRTLTEGRGFDLRYSPSQYDDLDHDLRLLLAGKTPVYQGHLAVGHFKSTGAQGQPGQAQFGLGAANQYKLHHSYTPEAIARAAHTADQAAWEDVQAKRESLERGGEYGRGGRADMTAAADEKPVLILQMQRMGDIVLSFPLVLWLRRNNPPPPCLGGGRAGVLSGAHGPFAARGVHPLDRDRSPGRARLQPHHQPEPPPGSRRTGRSPGGSVEARPCGRGGARCCASPAGAQLYRASLTHNNRHNRFHWAELNALDCVDKGVFAVTHYDQPRRLGRDAPAVGLFVGASQDSKRPGVAFFADLAWELERRGLKVLLFGGPGDVSFGSQVAQRSRATPVDLCGKLSLRQFVTAGQALDLLVTPDTGPMHVAAWSGLAVLNLSMGPVSPWETGPYPPGHYVLRASISCLDCWQCRFASERCRDHFRPRDVAYLVWRLVSASTDRARLTAPPATRLFLTGRTPEGFYMLHPVGARRTSVRFTAGGRPAGVLAAASPGAGEASARVAAPGAGETSARAYELLGEFWRAQFAHSFGLMSAERPAQAWSALAEAYPALALAFTRRLAELAGRIRQGMAASPADPGEGFWRQSPPMLRLLSGFVHMQAQNGDFTPQAWGQGLKVLEAVLKSTA